jgi:ParB family chromosome partitioning protein
VTRKALGRGIRALIPEAELETAGDQTRGVRLEEIGRGKFQPRQRLDPARLEELATSIRQKGLLQPIVVRRSSDGYELVAGERRLRAARLAGLTRVPVVVMEANDVEAAEAAIVENIQREDLNPIEKALAFRRLMRDFGLSQEDVSQKIACDRSSIANFLRLLQLPQEVQGLVSRGTLSMGHARALVSVPDAARQMELAQKAVSGGLSVRDTERMVREVLERPARPKKRARAAAGPALSPDELEIQNKAQRHLGTRVRLRRSGRGGEIIVEFYSDDDLNRVIKRMGVIP